MKIRASMLVLGFALIVAIIFAGYAINRALDGGTVQAHPLPRLVVSR